MLHLAPLPVLRRSPASFVARHLLGLTFAVFGLNGFFAFIKLPPPEGLAGLFMAVMVESGYLIPVSALQLTAGVLLLANRLVPLALALLAPIVVNIALYHALLEPHGLGTAAVVIVLWALVFHRHRAAFAGLVPVFQSRPGTPPNPSQNRNPANSS